jgi:hypothetical protein
MTASNKGLQAEKDIRALETTLRKLAEKIGQFRSSAESEAMAAEKESARAQLDRAYDKLKVKQSKEALPGDGDPARRRQEGQSGHEAGERRRMDHHFPQRGPLILF